MPCPTYRAASAICAQYPCVSSSSEGINQSQVIDDTYNNDLAGLEISIQFLQHQHQKKKKRLILSDILQSGLADSELVRHIAALVNKSTIDSFVGIGPVLSNHKQAFAPTAQFFASTDDFLQHFNTDTASTGNNTGKRSTHFSIREDRTKAATQSTRHCHGDKPGCTGT